MSINDKLKKHYEQALPIPDKVLVKKENDTYVIKSWADVIGIDTPLTLIGKWNASTNTPDITGATTGEFWIVTTAGDYELDGITSWNKNDWAVKTKLGWAKVDNQDSVKEVNGFDGYVVLEAKHIPYDNEDTVLESTNVQDAIDEFVGITEQSLIELDENKVDEAPADGNKYARQDEGWSQIVGLKQEVTIETGDWDSDNQYSISKLNGFDDYLISYAIGFADKFAEMEIKVVAEDDSTITIECESPDDITILVKGVY